MIAQGYAAYNPEFSIVIQATGHSSFCVFNPSSRLGHTSIDLDKAIKIGNATNSRANHTGWRLLTHCFIIPSK
jgi:hypothetical protein